MGHTFDADKASKLEDAASRYRYVSADELVGHADPAGKTVVDLGSGTGFYTDDVAAHAEYVYAIDLQEAMHEFYREKGVPENVELVTSGVADLPLADGAVDVAVSTMTYHEFANEESLAEVRRVLAPGGRLVVADWSADGAGDVGAPMHERYTPTEAADELDAAGFTVSFEMGRPETFVVVAEN